MAGVSRVCNVILRVWELICSVIVLGIVAHFVNIVAQARAGQDGRLIYTLVLASISTLYSIVCTPPFLYVFLVFPGDFLLFVAWLVSFGLLASRQACGGWWYWNYWGYYWGGWWRDPFDINGPGDINWTGCSEWRTVQAFSFIVAFTFLLSFILGMIASMKWWNGPDKAAKPTISNPMPARPQRGPETGEISPAPGTGYQPGANQV